MAIFVVMWDFFECQRTVPGERFSCNLRAQHLSGSCNEMAAKFASMNERTYSLDYSRSAWSVIVFRLIMERDRDTRRPTIVCLHELARAYYVHNALETQLSRDSKPFIFLVITALKITRQQYWEKTRPHRRCSDPAGVYSVSATI